MDQGYLILRDVVPAGKLRAMRAACETALERQKAAWPRDRKPSDPPGGMYATESQPRVMMERPESSIRRPPT